MEKLIAALQIFLKYGNEDFPTSCEHDVLYVHVSPKVVSDADKARLDEYGFRPSADEDLDNFYSYRFGSA